MDFGLSLILRAVDMATGPIRAVRAALSRLRDQARRVATALNLQRLIGPIRNVGAALGRLGGIAKGALGKLAGLAGLAGIGSVAGLGALATDYANTADGMAKMAARMGVSVERLQELGYASERWGSSGEVMNTALKDLNKNLGEAVNNTGEARVVFEKMGIDLRDSAGQVRPAYDVMLDLADALQKIPDQAQRVAVAQKVMGEGATELIPLLAKGRAEIEAMGAEARSYGLISADEAQAAENYNDAMTNMGRAFSGIRNSVMAGLIPALEPLVRELTAWVNANRDVVAGPLTAKLREWAGALKTIIPQVRDFLFGYTQVGDRLGEKVEVPGAFEEISNAFKKISDFLKPLTDKFGTLNLAFGALGAILLAGPITAVVSLTTAVIGLGGALMATPVGWFLGAIALIGGAVYLIYRNWDAISAWFKRKFDAVKAAFKDGFFNGIIALFREFSIQGLVFDLFSSLVKALTGYDLAAEGDAWISGLWSGVTTWFRGLKIAPVVSGLFTGFVKELTGHDLNTEGGNWISGLGTGITEWVKGKWNAVKSAFSEGFFGGIVTLFKEFSFPGLVGELFSSLVKALTGYDLQAEGEKWIGGLWDGMTASLEGLKKWLRESMEKLLSMVPSGLRGMLGLDASDLPAEGERDVPAPRAGARRGRAFLGADRQTVAESGVGAAPPDKGTLEVRISREGDWSAKMADPMRKTEVRTSMDGGRGLAGATW